LKEDALAQYALHESVRKGLEALGARLDETKSKSEDLPPAFLELNSFTFPTNLFESERWDLQGVELRNWLTLSRRGGKPAAEIGSAKQRSTGSYVCLTLPLDTPDPSQPGTAWPTQPQRVIAFLTVALHSVVY